MSAYTTLQIKKRSNTFFPERFRAIMFRRVFILNSIGAIGRPKIKHSAETEKQFLQIVLEERFISDSELPRCNLSQSETFIEFLHCERLEFPQWQQLQSLRSAW